MLSAFTLHFKWRTQCNAVHLTMTLLREGRCEPLPSPEPSS